MQLGVISLLFVLTDRLFICWFSFYALDKRKRSLLFWALISNAIKLEKLFFRNKFLMNLVARLIWAVKGCGFQKSSTKSVIFTPSKITRVKTVGFQPAFQEIFVSGRQASGIDSIMPGLFFSPF